MNSITNFSIIDFKHYLTFFNPIYWQIMFNNIKTFVWHHFVYVHNFIQRYCFKFYFFSTAANAKE